MKAVAKSLKGQEAAAMELYASGMLEAMYVAGMVADGAQISEVELQSWAEGAVGMPMVADHTVCWVTVENDAAPKLATRWIESGDDGLAAIGWACYSGIVAVWEDERLYLKEIEGLLVRVVSEVHGAENRVRRAMNQFVICVGCYVGPLSPAAKKAARKMGDVSVDVGDTACKVPVAGEYIAKVEGMGRMGRKRKTLRC
jgi:3-methyladenine DNA glycosylase AlkD